MDVVGLSRLSKGVDVINGLDSGAGPRGISAARLPPLRRDRRHRRRRAAVVSLSRGTHANRNISAHIRHAHWVAAVV